MAFLLPGSGQNITIEERVTILEFQVWGHTDKEGIFVHPATLWITAFPEQFRNLNALMNFCLWQIKVCKKTVAVNYLPAFQVAEMEGDVECIDGVVDNLLDEQSLQDTRLLNLELDTRQLLDDVEGKLTDFQRFCSITKQHHWKHPHENMCMKTCFLFSVGDDSGQDW